MFSLIAVSFLVSGGEGVAEVINYSVYFFAIHK